VIGERPLFSTGAEEAVLARRLYPNQGLHAAATAFGLCHPRALQYLETAPVLVLGGGDRNPDRTGPETALQRRQRTAFIQGIMRPLCERGAPLKDVMRAFSLAPPLRKLSAFALVPKARATVARLSAMDPAVLGRIIPAKPGPQRTWLSACGEWMSFMTRRGGDPGLRFPWAAEAMSLAGATRHEVTTVADFVRFAQRRPDVTFNEAWGWARATEEAHMWHARLTVTEALADTPFKPDSTVDLGPHPDHDIVDGFDFHALRTPLAICDEGTVMRHCVATYLNQVVAGDAHIVSIRMQDKRIATLELDRAWTVRQVQGKANSPPGIAVRTACGHYAFEIRKRLGAP